MREPSTLDHKPNVRAVISLVFGILGLVILPIVAPIVALGDCYGVRNNELALAGVILGWIGLVLATIWILALVLFAVPMMDSGPLIMESSMPSSELPAAPR